jgi:hypothetical protein
VAGNQFWSGWLAARWPVALPSPARKPVLAGKPDGTCIVDIGQWNYPPRDLRLSDADRDRALAELGEHFQAGRLTAGKLDDRSGQLLRARTSGELADVLANLLRDQAMVTVPGSGRRLFSPRVIVAVVIVIAVVGMSGHSVLAIVVPAAIVVLLVLRRKRGGGVGRRRWRRSGRPCAGRGQAVGVCAG